MDKLFLTILNMSLTGAFVIAAICLVRLPLKKAPKIISYCFWGVAGFRLVFPFSLESVFSLIPFNPQPIPLDIGMQALPRINTGISILNSAVSSALPPATPDASINPMQIWTAVGAWVWIVGAFIMLVYGVVSFILLKRNVSSATHIQSNVYEAGNIKSPFVLGLFAPKIYLPLGLSEQEREYILLHEQTHIRRRDYIIKLLSYLVLCLHWFNPFVWIAFILMGFDMEMSCDERVLKEIGSETKKDYSLSLLSLATERHIVSVSPLAFGEGCAKGRINNVLNFKKPSRWIVTAAIVVAASLSVGFAVNRDSSTKAVVDLVTDFGAQLQKVSLIAPADIAAWEIRENYADYVTPALLENWSSNPETAPGRLTSSPWPDRIEVLSAKKLSKAEYTIKGTIIWITSVEATSGGADMVQPIELTVIKDNTKWKISDVIISEWSTPFSTQ